MGQDYSGAGAAQADFSADLTLAALLQRWPDCAPVFWQQGMQCPGCPFSRFHSLKDACGQYGLDEGEFRTALARASKQPVA